MLCTIFRKSRKHREWLGLHFPRAKTQMKLLVSWLLAAFNPDQGRGITIFIITLSAFPLGFNT